MKIFVCSITALAAVMIGSASAQTKIEGAAPTLAPSATTDPLVQVYRFSGVRDDGSGANVGTASVFHCTNFSGVTENFRVQVREFDGSIAGDNTRAIGHNETITTSTHGTNAYFDDVVLNTGSIIQGSARIWATSVSIVCTASTIDAAAGSPVGVDLHGIRFNPIPGTEF